MDTIQHTQDLLNNPFGLASIITLVFSTYIVFLIQIVYCYMDIKAKKSFPLGTFLLAMLMGICSAGLFIQSTLADGFSWLQRGWIVGVVNIILVFAFAYLLNKLLNRFFSWFKQIIEK